MGDPSRNIHSALVTSHHGLNKSSKDVQSFVDSKFAQSILSHFYGFYDKQKFTDFELISCDRNK